MNEIKFSDFIDKLRQAENGLLSKSDLEKWLFVNIEVNKYIGISRKQVLSRVIVENFNSDIMSEFKNDADTDIGFIYMMYDVTKLFNIMFEYLNVTPLSKHVSPSNYDTIMKSGFYDWFITNCGDDYNKFCEVLDLNSGIKYLGLTIQMESLLSGIPSLEDTQEIANIFKRQVSKDKIDSLTELAKANNPIASKIADSITKESFVEVAKENGDINGEKSKKSVYDFTNKETK